jgi:anhydro-N-acetylmuramic acid kinase
MVNSNAMASSFERLYRKNRQRRILVISAGGETSGIQGLYFLCSGDSWEIISNASVPYPSKIGSLIETCKRQAVTSADLALLDYKVTLLFAECAGATLAAVPRALRKPTMAVVNQLTLFKGTVGEQEPFRSWNITLGDPRFLAGSIDVPVLSDFSRYSLLAGGDGALPALSGNLIIARRFSGVVIFLNIGLITHMTVVDRASSRSILESDTGPGMCLINRCAQGTNSVDGFDRDGSDTAGGTVDIGCLDALATSPWFLKEAPKEASTELFEPLLQKPCIAALAPADRLATMTALTARTIYDFFRNSFKEPLQPEAVIISGGGVNNASLVGYCTTYFGHLRLLSCEELGIPVTMRVPLTLGLSVDAFLMGKSGWKDRKGTIGSISLP